MRNNKGTFVISLDTELAWGSFDTGNHTYYQTAYMNTREVIRQICVLFDQYKVPTTWALVMHLLKECDGHAECPQPQFKWVNWYNKAPCNSDLKKELWYAPGILEQIKSATTEHEIAVHGYTHMILGDSGCTEESAEYEINRAIEIANENGIEPETYIFPRNSIGHLDILSESGISYYRGKDEYWYENNSQPAIQKSMRFIDELSKTTPPAVTPQKTKNGLVELPGSQILRPYQDFWKYTPKDSQLIRAKKGLSKAAETGKIFHLWFHPFNLGINQKRHLDLLDNILAYAAQLRRDGRLEFCTLAAAINKHVNQ